MRQGLDFVACFLEGHVVFLNYNAGFLPLTFPADLKETIVKLFILKKKDFLKKQNEPESTTFEIPADIQSVINIYRRKCL